MNFLSNNRLFRLIKDQHYITLLFILITVFTFVPPINELSNLIELKLLDIRYRVRGTQAVDPNIAILDIDTESLKGEGRWSWPYEKHAALLQILRRLEIYSIGFDIFLVEPTPPTLRLQDIQRRKQEIFTTEELRIMMQNSDSVMIRALKKSRNVFLPQIFNRSENEEEAGVDEYYDFFRENKEKSFAIQQKFSLPLTDQMDEFLYANESSPLLHYFAEQCRGIAFAQILPDADGVVRHYPLFYRYNGRAYLALSFIMALDYLKVPIQSIDISAHRVQFPYQGKNVHIPIDERGLLLVNWMGKYFETYPHIPYIAVKAMRRHIKVGILKKVIGEMPQFQENPFLLMAPDIADQLMINNTIRELEDEIGGVDTTLMELGPAYSVDWLLRNQLDFTYTFAQFCEATGVPLENQEALQPIYNNVRYHSLAYADSLLDCDSLIVKYSIEDSAYMQTCYQDIQHYKPTTADFPLFFEKPVEVERIGKLYPDYFKGKVLFYGLTATGTHDYNPTPYEPRYAMVGVHANIFNNIISQNFLKATPSWLDLVYWIILTLSMIFLFRRQRTGIMAGVAILFFLVNLVINYIMFYYMRTWMLLVSPSILIIGSFIIISVQNYWHEEQEKRQVKQAFSHYVTPSVVDIILKNPNMLQIGGAKRVCTVFFSDIQGFTTISEKLSPENLVELLNEYLSIITDKILENEGMLDKYEGDAVMAVFGAPLELADHAWRCCSTALQIQELLNKQQARWIERGFPALITRIGMNSGEMIVGNMGSKNRFDYTVIGDSVNLGSRLESANKEYGTYTMISEFTHQLIGDQFLCRELDVIRVKGKLKPVRVYELMDFLPGAPDPKKIFCQAYEEALALYKDRNWQDAHDAFAHLKQIYPEDTPISIYFQRSQDYLEVPPPVDWDGVFTMTHK